MVGIGATETRRDASAGRRWLVVNQGTNNVKDQETNKRKMKNEKRQMQNEGGADSQSHGRNLLQPVAIPFVSRKRRPEGEENAAGLVNR